MAMSRTNHDDHRVYEMWHRPASLKRFLTPVAAPALTVIDIDDPRISNVFYCPLCYSAWALAEDTRSPIGDKSSHVTAKLAMDAGKPAFIIRYWESDYPNPSAPEYPDIQRFEVARLWGFTPGGLSPEIAEYAQQTPLEHARWLFGMLMGHLNETECENFNYEFPEKLHKEVMIKSLERLANGTP